MKFFSRKEFSMRKVPVKLHLFLVLLGAHGFLAKTRDSIWKKQVVNLVQPSKLFLGVCFEGTHSLVEKQGNTCAIWLGGSMMEAESKPQDSGDQRRRASLHCADIRPCELSPDDGRQGQDSVKVRCSVPLRAGQETWEPLTL